MWYIIAWPCILGWKSFKFLLFNPVASSSVGGKNTGAGALVSIGLGIILLFGIPLAVWVGVPLVIMHGIDHFKGQHNPSGNLVCKWLGEKAEEKAPSEEAAPNAETENAVEAEPPSAQ